MISQYADANREQFKEFFINDNIDEVLCSLELNTHIDNIKRDGEYAGIIELSIASKIFGFNIYVYIENINNDEYYELYEKIDNENQKFQLVIYYTKMEIIFQF